MRLRLLAVLLSTLACGARVPVVAPPPAFPATAAWKADLPDVITPPLVTDGERVFVATADGGLRAFDALTGALTWGGGLRPGVLTMAGGMLLIRSPQGMLWALDARTGSQRWAVDTGVAGTLPAVYSDGAVYVAGEGLAAVNPRKGTVRWRAEGNPRQSAMPALSPGCVLTGESDGSLRCRLADSGAVAWTFATGQPLLASPVVYGEHALLGTTDGGFVRVSLKDGKPGWRWRLGADLQFAPLLVDDRVLFASHEAVLFSLLAGKGNLGWRASLPSRPLSGPVLFHGTTIVACYENDLIAFDTRTGKRLGSAQTSAVIHTPPIVTGDRLYVGLKDRTVHGLKLALVPPPPPSPSPSPGATPSPDTPKPASPAAASPSPAALPRS